MSIAVDIGARTQSSSPRMALLKIVVATALAPRHDPVRFERMGESLLRRLAPYRRAGVVDIVVAHAITRPRLQRLLRCHRPEILHVACHGEGSPRVLALEDRHGGKQVVAPEDLRSDVAASGWTPELTVLEACSSCEVAAAVVADTGRGKRLPRAIGMVADVRPDHGAHFFAALYHLLASGLSLSEALAEARRDLEIAAPGMVEVPVLHRAPGIPDHLDFGLKNLFVTRGIATQDQDDRVFVDPALATGKAIVGYRKEIHRLAHVFERVHDQPRVLHVRGAPGIGKTAVLAATLAEVGARGWRGAARVFAFAFASEQRGSERLAEFFDEALEFFGEHTPLHPGDHAEALATQALWLGRMVRREPALVVLDDVPTLPRAVGDDGPRRLEAFVHPALAVFLREVLCGGESVCVFSTRDDAGEVMWGEGDVAELYLGGLLPMDGAVLLAQGRLVDGESAREALAKRLGGHPLALALVGRNWPSTREAVRHFGRVGAISLSDVVAQLAGEAGSALLADLQTLAGPPPRLRAVRRIQRAGLVEAGGADRAMMRIAHNALRGALTGSALSPDIEKALMAEVVAGPHTLAQLNAAQRAILCLQWGGAWGQAVEAFVDRVCRRVEGTSRHAFVAETVAIAAKFFVADAQQRVNWSMLRPEVTATSDAKALGLLQFWAGLGLRSLGLLALAQPTLAAASQALESAEAWSEAARAECECGVAALWRGDPAAAEVAATHAAELAARTEDCNLKAFAQALRGASRHQAGECVAGRPEIPEDFAAAEAVNAGLTGALAWAWALDILEADRDTAKCNNALNRLAGRLAQAREAHQAPSIERYAAGLEALARGRLATLYVRANATMPTRTDGLDGWTDPKTAGRAAFATALAVFGATQELWLRGQVYRERAKFRDACGDQEGAEDDRMRAAWFA